MKARLPKRRRWCEIKFRWRHGWWCEHHAMSMWMPIGNGFYSLRQCTSCGAVQLR